MSMFFPQVSMFHGEWDDSGTDIVNQSWRHVVTQSGPDQSQTIQIYREALKKVEYQARSIYNQNPEDPLPETEDFIRTMIEHGCFVLQVALCYLRGSNRSKVQIFCDQWEKQKISYWVSAIFNIKKQLPLIILQELMKQSFFKRILNSKKWKRPIDMPRMVFYDFLVAPNNGNLQIITRRLLSFIDFNGNLQNRTPTLLHALWLLLTGIGSGWNRVFKYENNDEDDDDDENEENSSLFTVRSATELQKQGITVRSNNGKGVKGIRFKKQILNAYLFIPSILIEPNSTKSLLESLILYEKEMNVNENQRQVCGYLQLMREIIRTPSDVKLLSMKGVVHVYPNQEEELIRNLENLNLPEVRANHNLRLVRHQLRRYLKPTKWDMVTYFFRAILFLSLLQTVYAGLLYHLSHQNHQS